MKVTLLNYTKLPVAVTAIRACWQSGDKSDTRNECWQVGCARYENRYRDKACLGCGYYDPILGEKDRDLIDRVGNKFKHASTLEHLVISFYIEGISRALLQELARHRMASLSVKSTRYTIKELKVEPPFIHDYYTDGWVEVKDISDPHGRLFLDIGRAGRYLVLTGDSFVDEMSVRALENLRQVIKKGISNDKAKYCLPESYKTELTWTINVRSLQNFLNLRTDKSALWEIRKLAYEIYGQLPMGYKYLLTESVKVQEDPIEDE